MSLPGEVFQREGDGVLCHDRLPRGRVCRHKHTLVLLQQQDGLFLELIGLKRPLVVGTWRTTFTLNQELEVDLVQ